MKHFILSSKSLVAAMAILLIVTSSSSSSSSSLQVRAAAAADVSGVEDNSRALGVVLPETSPPTDAPEDVEIPIQPIETPAPTPATPVVPIETSPPTGTPTAAPVVAPTEPPVVETPAPTETIETSPPTAMPVATTAAPTDTPTAAPVATTAAPTDPPTETAVTPEPTPAQVTNSPTAAPVVAVVPTDAPVAETVPPTELPVEQTAAPTTLVPTSTPTIPQTATPTIAPTTNETSTPTSTPTTMPTFELREDTVQGLGMVLDGVALPMSNQAKTTFEDTYALHCEEFFAADLEQVSQDMQEYSTEITFVSDEPLRRRRRRLAATIRSVQETTDGTVLVTYDQYLEYRADPEKIDLQKAVEAPFKTTSRRQTFADLLVASGDPAYENLQGVGKLVAPGAPPAPAPEGKSNTNTIIIAVCASVGGLLVLGGGYMLYKRSKANKASKGAVLGDEEKPPSQLQLSTVGGDDAVSTLAEPAGRPTGVQSGEELAGYGDQSVATVDYDYSKAYGGGGEASVVSSAGGTLGQQTSGGGTLGSGGAAAAGLAAAGAAGASIFSDDASFEQNYGQNVSVKEEMIEIYAPPGKLGVVIDTPDEGAPVVHAIKDSSCIADQLKVGDKLIAVDDEDVRAMTAIKVSKMISRKSANPQRKLTVVRTTVSE